MQSDSRPYLKELLDFEPKMRSMINNFRSVGYRFEGHDEEDLTQELFVKALEIEGKYDAEKAMLRTWWYRCFTAHLVKLAERSGKIMKWAARLEDADIVIASPAFVETDDWRTRAQALIDEMMRELHVVDPPLARVCEAVMDLDGDIDAVADHMGIPSYKIERDMRRLRYWEPYREALESIPW